MLILGKYNTRIRSNFYHSSILSDYQTYTKICHIKYFEEQIKFIEAADCDYYDEDLELYQNRVRQFNIVLSMLKEKNEQIEEYRKISLRTHKQQVQTK